MSTTKLIPLALLLALAPAAPAQDAAFTRSCYVSPTIPNEIDVNLVISDTAVSIKSKKARQGIDIDIPFSSIDALSHERAIAGQWGTAGPAGSVGGLAVLKTSYVSQWLEIDSHRNGAKRVTVLHLDKAEYQAILDALQSKSGKSIAEAAPGPSPIDPTANSKDIDELVPYSLDAIAAALTPAMESMGCKVSKTAPGEVECKRGRATAMSELNGVGGEKVTALLQSQGSATRVQITTGLGFEGRLNKRNWSTPIYNEMLTQLKSATALPATSPPR
jgi:hypothetical protein